MRMIEQEVEVMLKTGPDVKLEDVARFYEKTNITPFNNEMEFMLQIAQRSPKPLTRKEVYRWSGEYYRMNVPCTD